MLEYTWVRMKQKIEEKLKAIKLRKRGFSLDEIVSKINVAKSSVSVWVREVELSKAARRRLLKRIQLGQLIAAENKKRKTKEILKFYFDNAQKTISLRKLNSYYKKIVCSLLYFCEGAKDHFVGVRFSNSDPKLTRLFINFFRDSFDVDEKKFRLCVHLHEYHNPKVQLKFWSTVTKIPLHQFIRPYLKPNTGKRKRENYPGCATIYYFSPDIARRLLGTARAFIETHGGIV